jgi:hypothetical protein
MDRESMKKSIKAFLIIWEPNGITSPHLRMGQTFIILFGHWFPDYDGPLFSLEDEKQVRSIIMDLLGSLDNESTEDFSKVQRYGMVTKRWYEDTWEDMGEDSYGSYVLYSDYKKLLKCKFPPRLPASFKDVCDVLTKEIKKLKNSHILHLNVKMKLIMDGTLLNIMKLGNLRKL